MPTSTGKRPIAAGDRVLTRNGLERTVTKVEAGVWNTPWGPRAYTLAHVAEETGVFYDVTTLVRI